MYFKYWMEKMKGIPHVPIFITRAKKTKVEGAGALICLHCEFVCTSIQGTVQNILRENYRSHRVKCDQNQLCVWIRRCGLFRASCAPFDVPASVLYTAKWMGVLSPQDHLGCSSTWLAVLWGTIAGIHYQRSSVH